MFSLTRAQISVASSKVFCKLGNGVVRDLTQDNDTVYVHPATKQCNYAYTHPTTKQCTWNPDLSNINAALLNGMNASQIISQASASGTQAQKIDQTLEGAFDEYRLCVTLSFTPDILIGGIKNTNSNKFDQISNDNQGDVGIIIATQGVPANVNNANILLSGNGVYNMYGYSTGKSPWFVGYAIKF